MQLFNAVKKHQKTVDDKLKEVGGSERKKAKILSSVSKRDFIDVLRRTEGVSSKEEKTKVSSTTSCVFFFCLFFFCNNAFHCSSSCHEIDYNLIH